VFRVYSCLTVLHDLPLILVAMSLCALSALAAVLTARRAFDTAQTRQVMWVVIAGLVTGVGIWGTHFVSMLAYQSPVALRFKIPETVGSLAIAVLIAMCGWGFAAAGRTRFHKMLGGAVVGAGIASMHFMGIAALDVGARFIWAPEFVLASVIIGMVAASAAVGIIPMGRSPGKVLGASACLVLAVIGMHLTSMAALTLEPIIPARLVFAGMSPNVLAVVTALAVLPVVAAGLIAAVVDFHLGTRKREETVRLRALADATFEGLAIVRDGIIHDMNWRFCELLRLSRADLLKMPLHKIALDDIAIQALSEANEDHPMDCQLRCSKGMPVCVEVLARTMDVGGVESRVLAFRDVSAERHARAKILHLAHHDPLTGLPNRLHFRQSLEEELARAWEDGTEVAIMCFDLDRFKDVNDVHGHAVGDALLKAVADRIQDSLPRYAIAARLSGDEFAVVLPGVSSRLDAATVAQRIVNNIGSPLVVGNAHLNVSASGGVTIFPLDGEASDSLMNQADLALYRAKNNGRNCVCEFDPELGALMQERRLLEADLAVAIEDEMLELHFQPQLGLGRGDLVGYEALVRWNDERRGYVPPSEFIQLAEESGHILQLGNWVLEEACREAVNWPDDRRVAVNVSPAQFKQGNLAYTIERALKASGLAPSRLEIEITEGVLIDDEARALKILRRLKDLGVGLAIDDFGTGYASLAYLRAFPFDKIKIDRGFLAGIQNDVEAQIIVRATIDLARQLDRDVVVEGIECFDELAALGQQPDVVLQGYLLSRPITRGQINAFDAESQSLRDKIVRIGRGELGVNRDVA
jgi:diguanylate cyclase (GGDEF)-like protein